MTSVNKQITLVSRPAGFPQESNFRLVEVPISDPADGEFLVENLYLSVDPYMRGRMNDGPSYAAPVAIGEVMIGECVGRVSCSRHKKFPEGTYVAGMFGWQEYVVSDGHLVRRINPETAPISTALHVLGMPGLTAYFGLTEACRAKQGDAVVVSGAAGAVGSTVGQLAKLNGCRAVGIAGSDEKINHITDELGYDGGFNYKTTRDYREAIRELCPDGVDVYFDNVGGTITDAVFPSLNEHARVAICGQISQYNVERPEQGPRLLWHLIVKRATVRGFLVFDFISQYREGIDQLTAWVRSGQLKYRENIVDGIANAPRAFFAMMQGANIGKQLVRLRDF